MTTNFKFNVALTIAAAQDALGQDILFAQSESSIVRKEAQKKQAEYRSLETDAAHFESISAQYSEMAKSTFRAFSKAYDESLNQPDVKSAIKLSYSHEDGAMLRDAIFSAVKKSLWDQFIASQEGMDQDMIDFRDFKGIQTLTPVELYNEYATNNKDEAIRLFGLARASRDECKRLFEKADQILIDARLGKIVEENKERAHAKKELEKGVKQYSK